MDPTSKHSQTGNYFYGGLAELVVNPTPITFSFLQKWFSGDGSLGKAVNLLGLPYTALSVSVLECVGDDLVVNLDTEEKILYNKTLFSYKKQSLPSDLPVLQLQPRRFFQPLCVVNTLRMLLIQSAWIANPATIVKKAQQFVSLIPAVSTTDSLSTIDDTLRDSVWPYTIAIGMLSEFYIQFLKQESKDTFGTIQAYLGHQMQESDWFFRSLADQEKVKQGTMDFSEFINRYGIRADRDYELTLPRWHEIPEEIAQRIESFTSRQSASPESIEVNASLQQFVKAAVELQLLRSEAKRKTLLFIDLLRKKLLEQNPSLISSSKTPKTSFYEGNQSQQKNSGKGMSVSAGVVQGISKYIADNHTPIEKGTIGIFPNASPEFAFQYPKCTGMIFLRGGQTSHGSIVAREFGIPAIIDASVSGLANNLLLEIDGTSGEWKILNK